VGFKNLHWLCVNRFFHFLFCVSPFIMVSSRYYYPKAYKEKVVSYYYRHRPSATYSSVAKQFGIAGGHFTVSRWIKQSHRTKPRRRSGRPPTLSRQEIYHLIERRIRTTNKAHKPINYKQIHTAVQQQVGKSISLRTIQRIGKETCGIKFKSTITRTPQERKYNPPIPSIKLSPSTTIC